jgi:hypothetical protein
LKYANMIKDFEHRTIIWVSEWVSGEWVSEWVLIV